MRAGEEEAPGLQSERSSLSYAIPTTDVQPPRRDSATKFSTFRVEIPMRTLGGSRRSCEAELQTPLTKCKYEICSRSDEMPHRNSWTFPDEIPERNLSIPDEINSETMFFLNLEGNCLVSMLNFFLPWRFSKRKL